MTSFNCIGPFPACIDPLSSYYWSKGYMTPSRVRGLAMTVYNDKTFSNDVVWAVYGPPIDTHSRAQILRTTISLYIKVYGKFINMIWLDLIFMFISSKRRGSMMYFQLKIKKQTVSRRGDILSSTEALLSVVTMPRMNHRDMKRQSHPNSPIKLGATWQPQRDVQVRVL